MSLAIDLYAMVGEFIVLKNKQARADTELSRYRLVGGAMEVSNLISVLPAYIFPDCKHPTGSPNTTWICAGVSQGGHSAWHVGGKGLTSCTSNARCNIC